MEQNHRPQKAAAPPVAKNKTPPVQTGILTDQQLLALFPNIPVGLATLRDGRKVLIFPRPADEARYMAHL